MDGFAFACCYFGHTSTADVVATVQNGLLTTPMEIVVDHHNMKKGVSFSFVWFTNCLEVHNCSVAAQ